MTALLVAAFGALPAPALAAPTIDSTDFCVGASGFDFTVELGSLFPGSSGAAVRIAADNGAFANPNERIAVNFDAGGAITYGPAVETFGSPANDRWQDGTIASFALTALGPGRWRLSGTVANGTNPFTSGQTVTQVLVRDFASPDVAVANRPIGTCASAAPTIDSTDFCAGPSGFDFTVELGNLFPGSSGAVVRIGADNGAFANPNERIAVNFDAGGAITYGPVVETFGSPANDRWQDGVIGSFSLTDLGSGQWRLSGTVAHGANPFTSGQTVTQVLVRDFVSPDVAVANRPIGACAVSSPTIDLTDFCVGPTGFDFTVELGNLFPGSSGAVVRIGADNGAFANPNERIAVNFDAGGAITYGPVVETFGSPANDRWQDGAIGSFSLTDLGSGRWRLSGTVPHGGDPFSSGEKVSQVLVRDFAAPDVAVANRPIGACAGSGPTISATEFCSGVLGFEFTVELGDLFPGSSGAVVRIGADNGVFATPNERIAVNFDASGAITFGPVVETFGTPAKDRWQDGLISTFSLTDLGAGSWRLSGTVPNGATPFTSTESVAQVLVRDFIVPDVTVANRPIGACALAPPRIDRTEFCSGGGRFDFTVELSELYPSGSGAVFRIGADNGAFATPNERIAVNFDAGGAVTYGPVVETFGTPAKDRWQDGVISTFSLTDLGAGRWRLSGSVPSGLDPFAGGESVRQVLIRDFASPDVAVANRPVAACGGSAPTIDTTDFCAGPGGFELAVELGNVFPSSSGVVFRIGADNNVFTSPAERLAVNFDAAGTVTYGPVIETFGSPSADRWRDGAIGDFTLADLGAGRWRVEATVPNGANPFAAGETVRQVLVRDFVSADVSLPDRPITACPGAAVEADFTYSPPAPRVGQTVRFRDLSRGPADSWTWDFGDGSTSAQQNPDHAFANAGQYIVRLVVGFGATTAEVERLVQVSEAPVRAEFSFTPASPLVGELVSFRNQSSTGVTTWSWDFGDGSTSSEESPTHLYVGAGVYTVQLRVADAVSSDTIEKRIEVEDLPGGAELSRSRIGVREGQPAVALEVRRGRAAARSAAVTLEVADAGARRGLDYGGDPSYRLEWGPGDGSSRTVVIPIIDDHETEGVVPESFVAFLRDPEGLVLGTITETRVWIFDDDVGIGSATVVASSSAGNPVVAYDDRTGVKVVAWEEPDGDGLGVFAQLYEPDGSPRGTPFGISQRTRGHQTSVAAAFDGSGRLVLSWLEESGTATTTPDGRVVLLSATGAQVLGRTFTSQGSPLGGEIQVSSASALDVGRPDASVDKSGDVVIAWEERGGPKARVLRPDGRKGAELRIDTELIEGASEPQVAKSAAGDFVAVWRSGEGRRGVRARLFDRAGKPRSGVFFVTTNSLADHPVVAMSDDGTFVVAWDEGPEGARDVSGQRYDRRGRPLGPPFAVNSTIDGDQARPRLDVNSVGELAVVWETDVLGGPAAATAGGQGIVARFFDAQGPVGDEVNVSVESGATVPADADISIDDGDRTTVVFERRDRAGARRGIESVQLSQAISALECDAADVTALCLQDQRFRVRAQWRDPRDRVELGHSVGLTRDSGYFWFFDSENVELVVKVLDGCRINGHYWVLATGLTDVEVDLQIDDVGSGDSKTYFNPLGTPYRGILDLEAFATCDAGGTSAGFEPEALGALADGLLASARAEAGLPAADLRQQAGVCPDGALCLGDGRFTLAAGWRTRDGKSGSGVPVGLTADTGYFWFFDSENVELVVKVLEACSLNGEFWVYAGGLTDVEVTLSVTDGETGATRVYENSLGAVFEPVQDTAAFRCR